MPFFRFLGRQFIAFLIYLGELVGLARTVAASFFEGRPRFRLTGQYLVQIGYGSQLVIVVTGAFTGAVLAAQSYYKFKDLGIESVVGALVSVAMCRELGAVLAGLMVAGRVGAAMAAEIGSMKVTEQIDALRAMGVHPVDYLVTPRFVAILISMPLLIAESIAFGIGASYVMAVHVFHIPEAWYLTHLMEMTSLPDISIGMIKGTVFGLLIVLISCHQGLETKDGAVGVGRGTTQSVVIASLAILIFNLFLTLLLNHFFPLGNG